MSSHKSLRKQVRTQGDFIEELGIQNRLLWTVLTVVCEDGGLGAGQHPWTRNGISRERLLQAMRPEHWVTITRGFETPGDGGVSIRLAAFPPAPDSPPSEPPVAARSGDPDSPGTDPTPPSPSTTGTSL